MYDKNGIHERVTSPVSGYKCSCGVIYYYYGECPVCKEKTVLSRWELSQKRWHGGVYECFLKS